MEILIECDCGFDGYAVLVKPKGQKYKHLVCPSCNAFVEG